MGLDNSQAVRTAKAIARIEALVGKSKADLPEQLVNSYMGVWKAALPGLIDESCARVQAFGPGSATAERAAVADVIAYLDALRKIDPFNGAVQARKVNRFWAEPGSLLDRMTASSFGKCVDDLELGKTDLRSAMLVLGYAGAQANEGSAFEQLVLKRYPAMVDRRYEANPRSTLLDCSRVIIETTQEIYVEQTRGERTGRGKAFETTAIAAFRKVVTSEAKTDLPGMFEQVSRMRRDLDYGRRERPVATRLKDIDAILEELRASGPVTRSSASASAAVTPSAAPIADLKATLRDSQPQKRSEPVIKHNSL